MKGRQAGVEEASKQRRKEARKDGRGTGVLFLRSSTIPKLIQLKVAS